MTTKVYHWMTIHRCIVVVFLIVFVSVASAWEGSSQAGTSKRGAIVMNKRGFDTLVMPRLHYPYRVTHERARYLERSVANIKKGTNIANVRETLGPPDEINDTYGPRKDAKSKTGVSYVYLIQRLVETGSELEKSERLIRVHFDDEGIVQRVVLKDIPSSKASE